MFRVSITIGMDIVPIFKPVVFIESHVWKVINGIRFRQLFRFIQARTSEDFMSDMTRSYLKIKIFGRNQGASENQPAGILKYVEDLKRGCNAEFGRKDFFEIASNLMAKKAASGNLDLYVLIDRR